MQAEADEIRQIARLIAATYSMNYGYDPLLRWRNWSVSAREYFWRSAQDDLGVSTDEQMPLSEQELERD